MIKGIWYTAGIVSPTIILLNAQTPKFVLEAVIKLPVSNVARQEKYENLLPILSFKTPNK